MWLNFSTLDSGRGGGGIEEFGVDVSTGLPSLMSTLVEI